MKHFSQFQITKLGKSFSVFFTIMLCQQRFTGFSFPSQCCVSCLSFFPSKPNNFFGKTFRYIILLVTLTKLIKRASRTINPSIFRCQRSAPIRRRTLHDTYFFRLISRNFCQSFQIFHFYTVTTIMISQYSHKYGVSLVKCLTQLKLHQPRCSSMNYEALISQPRFAQGGSVQQRREKQCSIYAKALRSKCLEDRNW